jgi:hypothetical protein
MGATLRRAPPPVKRTRYGPKVRPVALLLLAATAAPAAAAPARPSVAVIDLVANGASRELASAAAGVVATELDRLGAFKVVTSDAIRDMLAFEKQRQMLGCTEQGCLAEIGGALGVDYLVSGKVSRLPAAGGAPETVTLELTLSSVRTALREGSAIETGRSEGELLQRVGRAVGRLMRKLLAARSGGLVLQVTEAGAVVRVDDQVRGTSPLPGQLALSAGPHALSVEKDGFVAWQRELRIEPGQVAEERVLLVPSPDFVQAFEARQRRLRLGAWISTGVAAAGVAGAVLLQADAARLYGSESTPGTFLYDRRRLQDGVAVEGGVDLRTQADSLKRSIEQRERLSWVAAGAGVAGAVAATWLWIAGEDPERYARFRGGQARLEVAPRPGGLAATLSVGF